MAAQMQKQRKVREEQEPTNVKSTTHNENESAADSESAHVLRHSGGQYNVQSVQV